MTLPLPPPPPILKNVYYFRYSDRYSSGSFDMRTVTRWFSQGDSYYKSYIIVTNLGEKIELNGESFNEFEKRFNKLRDEQ